MNKTKHITFRATEQESERWKTALKAEGREVSEVCRATLERIAKRVEKKEAGK